MSISFAADLTTDAEPKTAPRVLRRLLGVPRWIVGRLFGFVAIVIGLAVAATIPGLQPLVLGYLLESSARVGRSGRLRDGLIGLPQAGRLGVMLVALFVCFLPAWFLSSMAEDALVIDPGGKKAAGVVLGFRLVMVLTFWHVLGAVLRGGRLCNFLWPRFIDTGRRLSPGTFAGTFAAARDAVWDTFAAMRLAYFYGLGFRVAVATILWLALPVTLLYVGGERPPVAIAGGLLTALVIAWLPWLQTQAAVAAGDTDASGGKHESVWRRMFAVGDVRRRFRQTPWTSAFALTLLLAASLPLNVLKIELIPREAAWLPGIVFVLFAIPGRLALGKVYAWGKRRTTPRRWYNVWPARVVVLAATITYVFVTYLSQTTAWYGRKSLYEQHAVLFPVPFVETR